MKKALLMIAVTLFLTVPFSNMANASDEEDVKKAAEKLSVDIGARNIAGVLDTYVRDFMHDGISKDKMKEQYELLFRKYSRLATACSADSALVTGSKAFVRISGMIEGAGEKEDAPLPCSVLWESVGAGYWEKTADGWKVTGNRQYKYKAAVYFEMFAPGEVSLRVDIKDFAGSIRAASVKGEGLDAALKLESESKDKKYLHWSLIKGAAISLTRMRFPAIYSIEIDDPAGGQRIDAEMKGIMPDAPKALSPAASEKVQGEIKFRMKEITSDLFSGKYIVEIFDKNGEKAGAVDSNSPEAAYDSAKLPGPGDYFYRIVATDIFGNIIYSGMQSFSYGGAAKVKYSFTDPYEKKEVKGLLSDIAGAVDSASGGLLLGDQFAAVLYFVPDGSEEAAGRFALGANHSSFCGTDKNVYIYNPLESSIQALDYNGRPEYVRKLEAGNGGRIIACDSGGVFVRNIASGKLEQYGQDFIPVASFPLPKDTAAFDVHGEKIYFAGSSGDVYVYSKDGKKLAEWKCPGGYDLQSGIFVFDEKGSLLEIVDYSPKTGGAGGKKPPYTAAIAAGDGKVFVGYYSSGCNVCGMGFEAGKDGNIIKSGGFAPAGD